MSEYDPQEQGWEREPLRTELKDSIRRRLPQAAEPPPIPELPEPVAPLEETSPNRPVVPRRTSPPAAIQRVVAALYLLTILVLLFVVIRYMFIRSPDRETLIYFGLPLLAIGYLAREMLNWSGDSGGDKDR